MPIDIAGLQAAMAGRYALERELGYGATASVYLARDLKVPKHVAIKVLNPDIALAVTTERFRREIKNTAPLTHSHILGLTDADVAFDTQTGQEILYYVMPYVEGGSLRDRIERDGPLAIREAVRIAWEVADALAFAHSRGVIHRDIKPGNILLAHGHAWVSDFGIARKEGDQRLTNTDAEPGTPGYKSPEQDVSSGVDHRTDIYSLGCVLYEMLVGKPPFEGLTGDSLAVQRLSGPAPAVSKSRRVPRWLDQVVAQSLAQKVADRYQTAIAFRDALRLRPSWVPIALRSAAVIAAAGGIVWAAGAAINGERLTAADTLTYAVLPVAYADSAGAERLTAALHDELAKWTGIRVVEQQEVREKTPARADGLTTRARLRLAERLNAGRFIVADASLQGDSLRLHGILYDGVKKGASLRERSVRVDADFRLVDSAAALLVDRLLFGEGRAGNGTLSYQARSAQERGFAAVRAWNLQAADSAFAAAAASDGDYAQAHLWLAQARFLQRRAVPTWTSAAIRAASARDRLEASEQSLVDALTAYASDDLSRACTIWREGASRNPYDFVTWYDLGTCLSSDHVVLADPGTPSGLRFRTSYYRAVKAFQRAYELSPNILRPQNASGYDEVRRVFLAGGALRRGHTAQSDSLRYASRPYWQGDTIAFVPFDEQDVMEARPWTRPERIGPALRQLRVMFHQTALAWVGSARSDPDALETLAVALEMLGDPACLDTLRRALDLVTEPEAKIRIAGSGVWMQLKLAVPLDVASIRMARARADSLLLNRPLRPETQAWIYAGLAALTGRARVAAELSPHAFADRSVPSALARDGPSFLAFAALGGPASELESLELSVSRHLEEVDPPTRPAHRHAWLARPAALAFPSHRLASVSALEGTGYRVLDAQAAFVRGDTARARLILSQVDSARRALLPFDKTLDALYPEAALLEALNDLKGAVARIDPTLNALASVAPLALTDIARSGALVRAMVLRAELANQLGDRATAARWARVVVLLWSNADEFLQPTVRRMERLAR